MTAEIRRDDQFCVWRTGDERCRQEVPLRRLVQAAAELRNGAHADTSVPTEGHRWSVRVDEIVRWETR
jgi:hypothetical protein